MGDSGVLREIAESCRGQSWSTAIRLLNSHSGLTSSPVLLCNRALCYSKLELYKHAVKDCDRALALNSSTLLAYLYKGQALVAMGKQDEGSMVWRRGYEVGLVQPSDLQILLQLHSLATQHNLAEARSSPGNTGTPSTSQSAQEKVKEASKNTITLKIRGGARKEGNISDRHEPNQGAQVLAVEPALARGISQVNNGNYKEAVEIFSQLIRENLGSAGALVGRGTAYAFQRRLEESIEDFTKAIELDPTATEAWKRRGQARAALAPSLEAIADFSAALELLPQSPEALYERGVLYYKFKDYESAIRDLQSSIALDNTNRYAYNYYGLALTATGEYVDGVVAFYRAIELDPSFKEAWTQLAKLHKDFGDAQKALNCLQKLLSTDAKYCHALRLKALLLLSLGDHSGAVKELTTALEVEPQSADCHYLRGSCFHAIGNYVEAVKDYEKVLAAEVSSGESLTIQNMAFYQREIAVYMVSKKNEPFSHYDIDSDLDPLFKEAWCKRLRPVVLTPVYNLQPLPKEFLTDGVVKLEDAALTNSRKILLEAADRIGNLIQYNCPGFLKNARQHRMAGLAVLDVAQRVTTMLQGSRIAKKVQELTLVESKRDHSIQGSRQNLGGVSSNVVPPCSSDEGQDRCVMRLKWRDLYSVAVRWRQAADPCDPVVWVDMLSEKEFTAGFGSHTPLLLGQAKVVRYYPNFPRAFIVAKGLILEQGHVHNAANRPVRLLDPMKLLAVDAAADCREMYDVVGEDFWVVTPCHSTAAPGKVLHGTRLTMQKVGLNGYDFSIRTPCTPPRWADYDQELTVAWEEYCAVYCERGVLLDNEQLNKQLQDSVLTLSFYWYNFMPLARGTAVVGYIMLLGLFLAANMQITASIPEGLQVDWEAILSPDIDTFMQTIRPWLYPSVKVDNSWQDLPNVSQTFATFGSAIAALSSHYSSYP